MVSLIIGSFQCDHLTACLAVCCPLNEFLHSHQIAPKYEDLSRQYTNVNFVKCDVDEAQEVARKYSITAMPSFVFIKNNQKEDLVRGADPNKLENTIKKHSDETFT